MNVALAIAVGLGGLAAFAWSIRLLLRGPRLLAVPLGYLALLAFTWVTMVNRTGGYRPAPAPDAYASTRPLETPIEDFVTSDTCRSCHPGEYHSWHASYHRTMTQVATADSVKGDFDSNFEAEFPGLKIRLQRDDDDSFWATYTVPRSDGAASVRKRRIVMTTGSHHYQVYWTDQPWVRDENPGDRAVYLVPYVYLFDEKQWVPRHASFLNPPEEMPEFHRWNESCVRCHSTHGISNPPNLLRNTYETRTVELGISCEACHGPAKAHIEANWDPLRRYRLHRDKTGDPTIVNPARLDHERSSETCGQCHSITVPPTAAAFERWKETGKDYRPGDDLDESALVIQPGRGKARDHEKMFPEFFERRFWADGMVRVAGREYHGLLNTPCFQKGEMSCLSCHEMHLKTGDPRSKKEWADDQLAPEMRDNAACLQCHEAYSDPAKLVGHSHHLAESSGSNCYNCHMPHTTYGLHKGIRSHQIDSPSVQITLDTGRPNACNLCHLDQTMAWTATHLHRWFDQPLPELSADQENIAASLLWLLKGDAGQRALLASGFGWDEARKVSGTAWMPLFLAHLHLDPYHAVRIMSNRSLRTIEGYENLKRYPDTEEAVAEAIRIWKTKERDRRTDPHLLMDRDGRIRQDEVERILRMRDNTPVYLNE